MGGAGNGGATGGGARVPEMKLRPAELRKLADGLRKAAKHLRAGGAGEGAAKAARKALKAAAGGVSIAKGIPKGAAGADWVEVLDDRVKRASEDDDKVAAHGAAAERSDSGSSRLTPEEAAEMYSAHRDEVPAEYRKLLEVYYKTLADEE